MSATTRYTAARAAGEFVPNAPLRELACAAVDEGRVTWQELASGVSPGGDRAAVLRRATVLRRQLGLDLERTHGRVYHREWVGRAVAVAIVRELGGSPMDFGL